MQQAWSNEDAEGGWLNTDEIKVEKRVEICSEEKAVVSRSCSTVAVWNYMSGLQNRKRS
jgi:hypothetical protein